MEKFPLIAVKYKYDECPLCFPRDPDAGIAFIQNLEDPREMRNLALVYQLTNVYSTGGRFEGSMFTHKAHHQVTFVLFCSKAWQPLKSDGTMMVYHAEIYNSEIKAIANFMLDQDPLVREYATRVYKMREQERVD